MPEISPELVAEVARTLHNYATIFHAGDWAYTRDHGDLVAIRYDEPFDHPWARLKRAVGYLFGRTDVSRWQMIRVTLPREKHLPDGILDGGNIITHWEETGEYLQFVQPSVGALIANWLAAEPMNPHAQRVAIEMRRIQDDYAARLGLAPEDDEDEA